MSRRLGVEKRPRRQNLQMWEHREVAGRRAEGPRGWGVAAADLAGGAQPGLSSREDFVRTIQTNVFIDSYYPKLLGDFSEDCENSGKSLSSYSEILSKLLISDRLGIGDAPESDSRITFETVRNTIAEEVPPMDKRIRGSYRAALHQSSRSRLTLDSKTYTLFSCASDMESAVHGAARRACGGGAEEETPPAAAGQNTNAQENGEEAKAVADWFAKLYKRIEIVEDMLQQTLVNSVSRSGNECSVKTESRRKSRVRKTRTKPLGGGILKAPPTAAGEREILDTDCELRNIKRRVRALEMKLKQTKMPGAPRGVPKEENDKPSTGLQPELPIVKRSSLLLPGVGKGCCCQFANSGESDTAGPSTEVFLNEFCRGEKEVETTRKVKRNLIAKCKRIKGICDSVINSSRKSSRSSTRLLEISEECSKVSYNESGAFRRHSFPEQISADAGQKATVVYMACQQENSLAPPQHRRKKSRKKRKDLCRKHSITNFVVGRKGGDRWEGGAFGDHGACELEAQGDAWAPPSEDKSRKKPRPPRSPLEILRQGGRIKIPVLFKEICKKEAIQKVSNISIRFVLVERDSKHPLRKLIKKLSLGSSPQTKEQYVFGVSTCRCENEIHQIGSMCGEKDSRNFIGG